MPLIPIRCTLPMELRYHPRTTALLHSWENTWRELTCSITDRTTVIDLRGRELILFEVHRTIESLTATIRSFNNRERGLQPWVIACEDDVRDLCM